MTLGPTQIEAIVREVLARLQAAPSVAPMVAPSVATTAAPPPVAPPAPIVPPARPVDEPSKPDALTLNDSVITVAALQGRVERARRLIVAPRAVVTPSAKDWLRARGVELIRASATAAPAAAGANSAPARPALGKLYLHAVAGLAWSPRTLGWTADSSWERETLVPASLPQAAAELAAVLGAPDRLGVLLARETHAALCLANRRDNVRAVEAGGADVVRVAVAQTQANLLIVDPTRGADYAIKRAVQEFLRPGRRQAPPAWRGDA